jgi:hypothetical protein
MRKFRKTHPKYYKADKWKKYYREWAREKRRKQRKLPKIRKCKVCNKEIKNRILSAIYCSDKCQQKMFNKRHPSRKKMYSQTYFDKTEKLCIYCKNPISDRKSGKQFCSDACLNARHKETMKKFCDKRGKQFAEVKTKLGCSLCGYNKYGGSLDFHHINPENKERRRRKKAFFLQRKIN